MIQEQISVKEHECRSFGNLNYKKSHHLSSKVFLSVNFHNTTESPTTSKMYHYKF